VTVVVVVISIIDSLRSFDLVYIMTRAGLPTPHPCWPTSCTSRLFNNYKMGYGAAIAVILFLISAVFIFIYLWRTFRSELEY